ncbi:hypothetical protein [Paracoccus yeei]|nr:hypothetical protein [Paracoccus yeei]
MTGIELIPATLLTRKAVVYVRQSCSWIIPIICASVKRLFLIRLLLRG